METINNDIKNLQNKITTLQEAKGKLNKISYSELTAEQEDYIISGSDLI